MAAPAPGAACHSALPLPLDPENPEEVVLGAEVGIARLITLNRPRQLNVISSRVVYLLAQFLESWEKDDDAKLIIFKGAGRAFSAGGDLKMFYQGRKDDSCLEVVYRMYWLCYHIHTYKKTLVALSNGITMGGGAAMVAPAKFAIVTEKTIFSMPEASVGLHSDCSFSYILPRLPGFLGEFLGLTGSKLNGKEMIAVGLATHFVPSEKFNDLENHLVSLSSADDDSIRAVIKEFSLDVQPDEGSIVNKLSTIDKCFCGESTEEIIKSLSYYQVLDTMISSSGTNDIGDSCCITEDEANTEGNEWISPIIKGLKRASPTGLKITLKSIRQGRKQPLGECLKREFRLTMNLLRSVISSDVYEGIRALSIDKDNAPKWDPPSLEEVSDEKVDRVFEPLTEELELHIPTDEESRWSGKFESTVYPDLKRMKQNL